MDTALHQIADGFMDQAVSGEGIFADKRRRGDGQAEMTAFTCAGMSGMAMRFILDFEMRRCQDGEPLAQQGNDGGMIAHAGRTFRKGFTVTPA